MSITSSLTQINTQINTYTPAVFSAVIAVEQAAHSQPGATKLQMAINAVLAGSQIAQGVPVPSVAAIASLVNVAVTFLNAFGIFNHGAKPNVPNIVVAVPVAVVVPSVPVLATPGI